LQELVQSRGGQKKEWTESTRMTLLQGLDYRGHAVIPARVAGRNQKQALDPPPVCLPTYVV